MKMFTNAEVAKLANCHIKTAQQFAQDPANEINFIGTGRRKIYVWFPDDVERFKNRVVVMGRPKKLGSCLE